MNKDGKYMWVVKLLRNMDEGQLVELFCDVEDEEALNRIASCAVCAKLKFLTPFQDSIGIEGYNDKEHMHVDNQERARDINSSN